MSAGQSGGTVADTTLGEVAAAYVAAQAEALAVVEPLAREDRPDAIHRMRVAARRLRSALATYRAVVDPAVGTALRDELRWLGGTLGEVRDAEVIQQRLLAAVAGLPHRQVVGDAAERITVVLGARRAAALRVALADLDGGRYLVLRERLDRFATTPPLLPAADAGGAATLPQLLARSGHRVKRAAVRAGAATPGPEQDAALHEVRKAAKRARYAAESAAPVLGGAATRAASRMAAVQDHLGAYQDVVVSLAVLRELAEQAQADGQSAFTYGVLSGGDELRARQLLEQAPVVVRRATDACTLERLRRATRR
jgi:CHAD domain-containing protein